MWKAKKVGAVVLYTIWLFVGHTYWRVQVQDMEYNLVNAKERVLGFPKECNALTY